jgi:hypothetical protein
MCRVVDTVLIDQETIYAPRHGNDRLLLGLKGSLNEYELDLLRQRSLSARHEKARRGELVVSAPVGFVKAGDHYEKDPDRRVQEAIGLVFDKVLELGSARRAIEDGRNPLILDARPKEIRLRDGMIAGAMPAAPEDLDSILAASRSAPTVVVYCACPNDASAAMVAKRLQQAGLKGNRSVDRRRIAVGSLAVTRLATISFDSFYFYSMPAPPA